MGDQNGARGRPATTVDALLRDGMTDGKVARLLMKLCAQRSASPNSSSRPSSATPSAARCRLAVAHAPERRGSSRPNAWLSNSHDRGASNGWNGVRPLSEPRWECLYAEHRAALYRAAAGLVGDADAEELVQEAFERAMRQPDFFAAVHQPLAWLRQVTVRLGISRLRRRALTERVLPLLVSRPSEPDPTVRWALRRLPPTQRGAIVLRYYFRADYQEIAATLGLSEASVGKILTRARAALRRDLS